jgi:hypothetical protein
MHLAQGACRLAAVALPGPVMQPQSSRELLAAMEELEAPSPRFSATVAGSTRERSCPSPRSTRSGGAGARSTGATRWGINHRLAPTCTRRVPVCPRAGFARDRSGSLTTGESGFARRWTPTRNRPTRNRRQQPKRSPSRRFELGDRIMIVMHAWCLGLVGLDEHQGRLL